jgi:hypothetical protein
MSKSVRQLPGEAAAVPHPPSERSAPSSRAAEAARRGEAELLRIEGVEGVGASGGSIVVYTRDAAVARRLPRQLGGVPVRAQVMGEIVAYDGG